MILKTKSFTFAVHEVLAGILWLVSAAFSGTIFSALSGLLTISWLVAWSVYVYDRLDTQFSRLAVLGAVLYLAAYVTDSLFVTAGMIRPIPIMHHAWIAVVVSLLTSAVSARAGVTALLVGVAVVVVV